MKIKQLNSSACPGSNSSFGTVTGGETDRAKQKGRHFRRPFRDAGLMKPSTSFHQAGKAADSDQDFGTWSVASVPGNCHALSLLDYNIITQESRSPHLNMGISSYDYRESLSLNPIALWSRLNKEEKTVSRSSGSEGEVHRREELHRAEHWYTVAIAQAQRLLDELDSLPLSEGDLALIKALRFQKEMMDEYAEGFTRLAIEGGLKQAGVRPKPPKQRERIKPKPLSKAAGSISSV
jgi:hypothetical protein